MKRASAAVSIAHHGVGVAAIKNRHRSAAACRPRQSALPIDVALLPAIAASARYRLGLAQCQGRCVCGGQRSAGGKPESRGLQLAASIGAVIQRCRAGVEYFSGIYRHQTAENRGDDERAEQLAPRAVPAYDWLAIRDLAARAEMPAKTPAQQSHHAAADGQAARQLAIDKWRCRSRLHLAHCRETYTTNNAARPPQNSTSVRCGWPLTPHRRSSRKRRAGYAPDRSSVADATADASPAHAKGSSYLR